MKQKRIQQKIICNEDHFGYLGDAKNPKYFHPKPKTLNIFPVEGDPNLLAREVLNSDLSEVIKFRFDPVNVCNLACVFCTTDLQVRHSQISVEYFEKILKKIYKTCHRISIGCHFEPLMTKNIHEYLNVLKKFKEEYFQQKTIITIVTNGLLLHKRNIDQFKILDWLHISVHSHNKENFENIEKKANFDTFVSNIKHIRNKFKKLNIHFEFVANEKNKNDVEKFIPWAFDKLGIDTLNIRRVFTNSYAPRSYLDQSLKNGDIVSLKDSDWKIIENKIKKIWPDSNKSYSPGFGLDQTLKKSPFTEVIEL
tara:strand:+ start:1221 stop:2147 length:927 start_codon:yes stop_codon:yes gene_type:complete